MTSGMLPVPAGPSDAEASFALAQRATADFIFASKAAATRKAYAADWRDFDGWCAAHARAAIPADPLTVATYLSALAVEGRKLSTIRRRLAAIGDAHRQAGFENPCAHPGVRGTVDGISRRIGSAPDKKAALTADILQKAIRKIPDDIAGLRDRALILLGFAAALRRSELVALERADIRRHPKGIVLTIRRSKTDQAGEGKTKAIPHGKRLHVIAALDAWLHAARIIEGPVFRGVRGSRVLNERLCTRQVARIVKARVAAIGLDPSVFGAHSLRSGFITSAADHGASLQSIAGHAGHDKLDTTMGYVQVRDAFRDHSGKGFL